MLLSKKETSHYQDELFMRTEQGIHVPDGYNPKGCNTEQRLWVRRRDSDTGHPEDCRCQFHAYKQGSMEQCKTTLQTGKVEIHHIYPKGLERMDVDAGRRPPKTSGENPYNLIGLCAGEKGQIGHHDLMSPQMIIAKQTYRYDRDSYERALNLVHQGEEMGLPMYNHEYDGMLKMIARDRTDTYLRANPKDKFPYTKNPDGKTSLPNNGTIFDNHIKV